MARDPGGPAIRARISKLRRRVAFRLSRRLERIRREGIRRVIADDARRGRAVARRAAWAARNDCSPNARPIFIVGLQRSGTNMLLRAFSEAPEAEIHNESGNSRAFERWHLREDEVVRSLVRHSRHRCIVFKALEDSHRVVHLMDELSTAPGRTIWIYRHVADRVTSVYAKWPGTAGYLGKRIADGVRSTTAGLSDEHLALVESLDPDALSPASGAALYWFVRNALFFDLGLDQRSDVALVSYERFVADPVPQMRRLCELAGIPFRPRMVHGVARRPPPTTAELEIDPRIGEWCVDLLGRLDTEVERQESTG